MCRNTVQLTRENKNGRKQMKKKKHLMNNYEVNNHNYTNNNIGVSVKHRHPYACRLISKYCPLLRSQQSTIIMFRTLRIVQPKLQLS